MLQAAISTVMQSMYQNNEYRTSIICVDSYENKQLRGRLFNPYLSGELHFENVMQFLCLMEDLLNQIEYPQSFTTPRRFWQDDPRQEHELCHKEEKTMETPAPGQLGMFQIRIIFRQNASWQGSISWLDHSKEESFRSVLELLLLIDNALSVRP